MFQCIAPSCLRMEVCLYLFTTTGNHVNMKKNVNCSTSFYKAFNVTHRRRIYIEEKAKVVAGPNLVHSLSRCSYFKPCRTMWRTGQIHPFLHINLVQFIVVQRCRLDGVRDQTEYISLLQLADFLTISPGLFKHTRKLYWASTVQYRYRIYFGETKNLITRNVMNLNIF